MQTIFAEKQHVLLLIYINMFKLFPNAHLTLLWPKTVYVKLKIYDVKLKRIVTDNNNNIFREIIN